ncbi:outer membrane lipid asymmetry maintenance protein MlaD [Aestuariirhabdus litorea]|uniref:Outer membrane lipid asymmetry maintenance protein MlaD n=1 Tax=Aestuariirhabdus litorea TaxID=2528527 RepID=A0A3P3VP87_9GAMM|nr:outer membrane lipid asymmetry maintenance protein MlaD [Aestuariirhabdus litorea]RRJ83728.1 outer membrane lipid asymmetry maintenance protein MlaD [Aestuariirhabdus litorea]RWW96951.1 outer membrane lipid asymmetry maintenance protein MlaD [Endozoicomonadaceae bacterium GTF-13]
MRMRTVEISVGAFIVAGILALVMVALRVSGLTISAADNDYRLIAHFSNVGGLGLRAKVSMSGVAIGKVVAIEYDRDAYDAKVTMEISGYYDNIPYDSTASILTSGLLGEQYVGISVGGDSEYLADGDEFEDTQSAMVLEELIGKFLLNSVE